MSSSFRHTGPGAGAGQALGRPSGVHSPPTTRPADHVNHSSSASSAAAPGATNVPAMPGAAYAMGPSVGGYRLVRAPVVHAAPPVLDAAQRAVVEHRHGPLLVLAGPGTGKTTTLVEAVTARVRAGTPPERVLVLTFSREAALDLRERLSARLTREGEVPGDGLTGAPVGGGLADGS